MSKSSKIGIPLSRIAKLQWSKDNDESIAIVVDTGSSTMKIGFAGNDEPTAIVPTTTMTTTRTNNKIVESKEEEYKKKEEEEQKKEVEEEDSNNNNGIIHRGMVMDWEALEQLWYSSFTNELKINAKENNNTNLITEYAILVIEPPLPQPKRRRERIAKYLFDTLDVPGIYFSIDAVLSLYSIGKTTGCVVDSGAGSTNIVPIYEGYALPQCIMSNMELGGNDLTQYLYEVLFQDDDDDDDDNIGIAEEIKKSSCYVALDFEEEIKKDDSTIEKIIMDLSKYKKKQDQQGEKQSSNTDTLNTTTLTVEQFMIPEFLFQPKLWKGNNSTESGIIDLILRSMHSCDEVIRNEIFNTILLTGGNTLFPGFYTRFKKDLQDKLVSINDDETSSLSMDDINIIAPSSSNPIISAWVGGSIIASVRTASSMWITKESYESEGTDVIHKSCY